MRSQLERRAAAQFGGFYSYMYDTDDSLHQEAVERAWNLDLRDWIASMRQDLEGERKDLFPQREFEHQ